jgi:hypothetical protein
MVVAEVKAASRDRNFYKVEKWSRDGRRVEHHVPRLKLPSKTPRIMANEPAATNARTNSNNPVKFAIFRPRTALRPLANPL